MALWIKVLIFGLINLVCVMTASERLEWVKNIRVRSLKVDPNLKEKGVTKKVLKLACRIISILPDVITLTCMWIFFKTSAIALVGTFIMWVFGTLWQVIKRTSLCKFLKTAPNKDSRWRRITCGIKDKLADALMMIFFSLIIGISLAGMERDMIEEKIESVESIYELRSFDVVKQELNSDGSLREEAEYLYLVEYFDENGNIRSGVLDESVLDILVTTDKECLMRVETTTFKKNSFYMAQEFEACGVIETWKIYIIK